MAEQVEAVTDDPKRLAAECRRFADQAVTEGVNLKYVQQMREKLYEATAALDALAASLENAERELDARERSRIAAVRLLNKVEAERDRFKKGLDAWADELERDALDADRAAASFDRSDEAHVGYVRTAQRLRHVAKRVREIAALDALAAGVFLTREEAGRIERALNIGSFGQLLLAARLSEVR